MMTVFDEEKKLIRLPDKDRNAISLVIAFPNIYSIGMASLGFQNAWKLFNQSENVNCTRWFIDAQESCRGAINRAPYIGFSFSWELDYKNIFKMLEDNEIPLLSKDRKEEDPLIFAGGQVINANPEPFVDNFDFLLVGDLEEISVDFINKIVEIRDLKKDEKLNELRKVPGVYVPCRGVACNVSTAPIKRLFTSGNLSHSSILTPNSIWPNTFVIEVVRSCPELCRFCLASYGSLPFRKPDLKNSLIPAVDFGLNHTNKIGLMGPSVTQHPEFETLIDYLLSKINSVAQWHSGTKAQIQVQIASVRADTISKNLAEGLYKLGAKSITMAVETGSEKLRGIINKKVSNELIENSIQIIYDAGFNSIKLYGMVGLPYETQDDLKQTIEFLKKIKSKNKAKKLVWSCSVFVPKAQTPFQYFGIDKNAKENLNYLGKKLHQIGVDFRPESYGWATIQALISRGGKNINKVLEQAYRHGSTLGSFKKAMRENSNNVDIDYFIFKNWEHNSSLPWENIQGYLNKDVINEHIRKVEIFNV